MRKFETAEIEEAIKSGKVGDLLSQVGEAWQRGEKITGKMAQHGMVVAYRIATVARENDDVWNDICAHPSWEKFRRKPKREDQPNALQAVLRLSVGFGGPRFDKIVSVRFRALRHSYERNVSPDRVQSLLKKHGGAEGLIALEKERLARSKDPDDVAPSKSTITIALHGKKGRRLLECDGHVVIVTMRVSGIKRGVVQGKPLKVNVLLNLPVRTSDTTL